MLLRFATGTHWSQEAAARCPNEQFPTMSSFLTQQTCVFNLGPELMPPNEAITGAITPASAPITKEVRSGIEVVYTTLENEEIDHFLPDITEAEVKQQGKDLLALSTTHNWRIIQQYWLNALDLASSKIVFLKQHPFEAYIRRMNNRALKVSCLNVCETITLTNTLKVYIQVCLTWL